MSVLVVAENYKDHINPATLHAISAGGPLGKVDVLVTGSNCRAAAEAAAGVAGVSRVLIADDPRYAYPFAETLAPLVTSLAGGYDHLIAAATSFGKNLMPRIAALLDVAQVSDVIAIEGPDTFVRPMFAGNALTTVRATDPVKVLTVRMASFAAAVANGGMAVIETVAPAADPRLSRFLRLEQNRSERPELTNARVVVSGGRGMRDSSSFKLLDEIAARLGGAVGASRAAVDSGFAPYSLQVGQTGKVVAPDLYIAVGISGAIQHVAGMKDSKVIVAINTDREAPIFEIADYGIVDDLFKVLPEFAVALDEVRAAQFFAPAAHPSPRFHD